MRCGGGEPDSNRVGAAVYHRPMLAVVWHYWIAAILVIGAVIPATVGLFAMYLRKTQAPKYGSEE